ncbi:MAG: hypothetical protein JXA44_05095 [Methanospirillaceae archaeon]|nr:hypothetical protein [Methanospirillaceae archaeon]
MIKTTDYRSQIITPGIKNRGIYPVSRIGCINSTGIKPKTKNQRFNKFLPKLQNRESSQTKNRESGSILVLPPGMTDKEYGKLTNPGPFYKISQPPEPPAPQPTPNN